MPARRQTSGIQEKAVSPQRNLVPSMGFNPHSGPCVRAVSWASARGSRTREMESDRPAGRPSKPNEQPWCPLLPAEGSAGRWTFAFAFALTRGDGPAGRDHASAQRGRARNRALSSWRWSTLAMGAPGARVSNSRRPNYEMAIELRLAVR
uniref:Uncharacterized protein n=1 Tax=Trichuris muris TaxID=70415 RepID=A0A5S6QKL0_TRIMR